MSSDELSYFYQFLTIPIWMKSNISLDYHNISIRNLSPLGALLISFDTTYDGFVANFMRMDIPLRVISREYCAFQSEDKFSIQLIDDSGNVTCKARYYNQFSLIDATLFSRFYKRQGKGVYRDLPSSAGSIEEDFKMLMSMLMELGTMQGLLKSCDGFIPWSLQFLIFDSSRPNNLFRLIFRSLILGVSPGAKFFTTNNNLSISLLDAICLCGSEWLLDSLIKEGQLLELLFKENGSEYPESKTRNLDDFSSSINAAIWTLQNLLLGKLLSWLNENLSNQETIILPAGTNPAYLFQAFFNIHQVLLEMFPKQCFFIVSLASK